jgi:RNA polymerase-binding transcription factor DksA
MNKDLNHYKDLLTKEKNLIISELSGLALNKGGEAWEASAVDPVDTADREDVALNIEGYQEKDELVRVLETQLSEVDHALSKIDNGTFGICEISGEEIEEDRLEANPSARTCKSHMNQ